MMSSSPFANYELPSSAGLHPTEAYQYTPLKERQIRLLVRDPGADEDIISCSLEVVDIDQKQEHIMPASCGSQGSVVHVSLSVRDLEFSGNKWRNDEDSRGPGLYDALSYVWGNPQKSCRILCKPCLYLVQQW
jgi:hypothetical protein